jgi:hypothetical protein
MSNAPTGYRSAAANPVATAAAVAVVDKDHQDSLVSMIFDTLILID